MTTMANSQGEQGRECTPCAKEQIHNLEQNAKALLDAVSKGVDRVITVHGLTRLDFALIRLFLSEHEWTTTDLARVLPVEVSAISRMVKKLVSRGLLFRRRSRRDRRIVFLKLTEAGAALGIELQSSMQAYEESLTVGIGKEELDTFVAVIRKILANCCDSTDS